MLTSFKYLNMGKWGSRTKERVGIPAAMSVCHTVEVGGYFVEGHVPAEDIKRLLRERPDAKRLTVPGMPAGSPGWRPLQVSLNRTMCTSCRRMARRQSKRTTVAEGCGARVGPHLNDDRQRRRQ